MELKGQKGRKGLFHSRAPPVLLALGWAGEYFLEGPAASPSANPSGDGVDNLLKYAFNLSPLSSSAPDLVPGTGLSGLPRISTLFSGPAPVWRYEFIRRRGTGLT